jgi:hypothetical protein
MAKRKRRKRPRKPDLPANVISVKPPKVRLKGVFRIYEDIASTATESILATESPSDPAARFDINVLERGLNAIKSVRLLLEQAHWEIASAPTRQLFELLINMEHLSSLPDRDVAMRRYTKFGLLQMLRRKLLEFDYATKTGRDLDMVQRAKIEMILDEQFAEFRTDKGRWRTSWCGKNARDLAEESKRSIRIDQYLGLFSSWSEQMHASPGALVANLNLDLSPEFVKRIITDDDREIIEVAAMAITLFVELWWQLPNVAPLPKSTASEWLAQISSESTAASNRARRTE